MTSDSLIAYHQQAEDEGTYVLADRAREADRVRPNGRPQGPSENTD